LLQEFVINMFDKTGKACENAAAATGDAAWL
jgi:hypothetical protein